MAIGKDFEWITTHYSELQKKYPNMYIAVKDGKIVASAKEFGEAYNEARAKVKRDFITEYILSGEPFVLEAHIQDNRG